MQGQEKGKMPKINVASQQTWKKVRFLKIRPKRLTQQPWTQAATSDGMCSANCNTLTLKIF